MHALLSSRARSSALSGCFSASAAVLRDSRLQAALLDAWTDLTDFVRFAMMPSVDAKNSMLHLVMNHASELWRVSFVESGHHVEIFWDGN